MNRLTIAAALVTACFAAKTQPCSGADYIKKSAIDKHLIMTANVNINNQSADWYSNAHVAAIFTESMEPTFDKASGDEMAKGQVYGTRAKYIHTVGSIGKVKLVSTNDHPYTGLFKGANSGFARMSLAQQPDALSLVTAPGMGLKFLRDGIDSGNLVAMYGVDGQDSWNFFKNSFTNHIARAGAALLPLAKKFSSATPWVQQVGLSDMAQFGEDGVEVLHTEVKFPYSLRFAPTGKIAFPDAFHGTFTDDFATIPVGETLYEVMAMDQPKELGGVEKKIGDLILDGKFTTSKWADQHFFIRHQKMDEDIADHPEWKKYTPTFSWRSHTDDILKSAGDAMDKATVKAKAIAAGCPFGFLM